MPKRRGSVMLWKVPQSVSSDLSCSNTPQLSEVPEPEPVNWFLTASLWSQSHNRFQDGTKRFWYSSRSASSAWLFVVKKSGILKACLNCSAHNDECLFDESIISQSVILLWKVHFKSWWGSGFEVSERIRERITRAGKMSLMGIYLEYYGLSPIFIYPSL